MKNWKPKTLDMLAAQGFAIREPDGGFYCPNGKRLRSDVVAKALALGLVEAESGLLPGHSAPQAIRPKGE